MSDIIVKGMQMPQTCLTCDFNVVMRCIRTGKTLYQFGADGRQPDCPLRETVLAVHEKTCEGCKWEGNGNYGECLLCTRNFPDRYTKKIEKGVRYERHES